MNAYKVTIAAGVTIHAGILVLHSSQAQARMHRLTALGDNRYEVRDPPVFFKRGETFGLEGDLPKGMAIPISALGKWVQGPFKPRAPVYGEKKILQIPRAIPEQQNAPARTPTASATATREARKAKRLGDLKRFIDDVYEAASQSDFNLGSGKGPQPASVFRPQPSRGVSRALPGTRDCTVHVRRRFTPDIREG